jgi:hypothetical protein
MQSLHIVAKLARVLGGEPLRHVDPSPCGIIFSGPPLRFVRAAIGHGRGQAVFGFSLAGDPEILELSVRDESQAAAIGEAKRAADAGDESGAHMALRQLAKSGKRSND